MLSATKSKNFHAPQGRFAIVASEYNGRYVGAMLRAAKAELKRAGAKSIQVIRVPGAYEIPVVVARLARAATPVPLDTRPSTLGSPLDPRHPTLLTTLDAVICLGLILRGETVHAAHIGEAVSRALMEIQVRYEIPVIHEVLLLENEAQARARCLSKTHNRGAEAAHTALSMTQAMAKVQSPPHKGAVHEHR